MPATQTYSATEFKAKCLEVFDRLAARKLTRVTITKRGKVVAVVTPPDSPEERVRTLYGFMEGTVNLPPDLDLTAPILEDPFEAESGKTFE